jgi:hypothetical protein
MHPIAVPQTDVPIQRLYSLDVLPNILTQVALGEAVDMAERLQFL